MILGTYLAMAFLWLIAIGSLIYFEIIEPRLTTHNN